MNGGTYGTLGAYCIHHQSPRCQSPGLCAVRCLMVVCVAMQVMAWLGPAGRRLTVRAGRGARRDLFRDGISGLSVRARLPGMPAPRKQCRLAGSAFNCLACQLQLTFQANLFPVFPRENGCSQSVLGTELINGDNGLRWFFGFVPNVPKKNGQYPEERLRGASVVVWHSMRLGNDGPGAIGNFCRGCIKTDRLLPFAKCAKNGEGGLRIGGRGGPKV